MSFIYELCKPKPKFNPALCQLLNNNQKRPITLIKICNTKRRKQALSETKRSQKKISLIGEIKNKVVAREMHKQVFEEKQNFFAPLKKQISTKRKIREKINFSMQSDKVQESIKKIRFLKELTCRSYSLADSLQYVKQIKQMKNNMTQQNSFNKTYQEKLHFKTPINYHQQPSFSMDHTQRHLIKHKKPFFQDINPWQRQKNAEDLHQNELIHYLKKALK